MEILGYPWIIIITNPRIIIIISNMILLLSSCTINRVNRVAHYLYGVVIDYNRGIFDLN